MKILSHDQLMYFCSFAVGALSVFWLVWDLLRLRRFAPRGRVAHDEIFGSFIGIAVALVGIIGVIRFNWGG